MLETKKYGKEQAVLSEVRSAHSRRKSPAIPDLATALYSIEQDKRKKKRDAPLPKL